MFRDTKAPGEVQTAAPKVEPYPEPYTGLGLCYLDRMKLVEGNADVARQVYLTGKAHTGNL